MINWYFFGNVVILLAGLLSLNGWGFIAAGLAFLNAFGQYKLLNGEVM